MGEIQIPALCLNISAFESLFSVNVLVLDVATLGE